MRENSQPPLQERDADGPRAGPPVWLIGPAFLVVAAWFVYFSPPAEVPRGEVSTVARDRFQPGARRRPMQDPASVVIGGYSHACVECHRFFDSPPVELRRLVQHTNIVLNHGMNNRCFNCHDRADRAKLVLHDGTRLGFSQVPRLCSQCHGTVYRDWQSGMHGKTMGSWDVSGGNQHRLMCNDCHDPHSPAYKPIEPLPAPRTLRMGDQAAHPEPPHRHIPLRRWSLGLEAETTGTPEPRPGANSSPASTPPPAPHDASDSAHAEPGEDHP